MHNRERIYDAGMRAARPLAHLLAGLHPKGSAAVEGRAAATRRFAAWGEAHRDPARPLFLVHAPSVGEALMAQAIITSLRISHPEAQVAFTFFSPSAERIADRVGADVSGYLPFDTRATMRALTTMLRPSVIAFVRTEIWPMLGIEAAALGARTALVNAVLAAGSSRVRAPARFLLGPAYRRLDAIGAVSADDAARFEMLGASPARIHVTGDARFDQVWERISGIDRTAMMALRDHRPLLVAGSTWPVDDDILCTALASIPHTERPRIVIAPHEPTEAALTSLETRVRRTLGTVVRLSEIEVQGGTRADCILIDRLGVLADVYAAGDAAYVGGGFGTNGLHSVVEPAALGVPVLYGPRHGNAREAGTLAESGGGFVIHDAESLAVQLQRLLSDATARRLAGTAAVDFVRGRLGGAASNAALLSGLIANGSTDT